MAKKPEPRDTLLDETETLLAALVREANLPGDAEAGGPDFSDRLKVVDAVSRFLVVKHKLAPPEKAKSMFEGMLNDLHSGPPSGRASAPSKGKGPNGTVVAPPADAADRAG